MIVPSEVEDDLGQPSEASATYLEYTLEIGYRGAQRPEAPLEILREDLRRLKKSDAARHLGFPIEKKWLDTVIKPCRRSQPFISTTMEDSGAVIIKRHQDGIAGRTKSHAADKLPRTVLSDANAAESPSALAARREMASWRRLQFESTALRAADDLVAPSQLGDDGSHMPATLARMTGLSRGVESDGSIEGAISLRLSELLEGIDSIGVERDDKRDLFTLWLKERRGPRHAARALSDGTLRFLALALLENDPLTRGLICLEEPENGIHPTRMPAMHTLLKDIAVDPQDDSDENPLRQVIVATHSPAFVGLNDLADLLMAERAPVRIGDKRCEKTTFRPLPGSWRETSGYTQTSLSPLLNYLAPAGLEKDSELNQLLLPLEVK